MTEDPVAQIWRISCTASLFGAPVGGVVGYILYSTFYCYVWGCVLGLSFPLIAGLIVIEIENRYPFPGRE